MSRRRFKIDAFITNECGGSIFNGWVPAAILGLSLVDAPCNGRAHPTGLMGSMGLHRIKDYISVQSAVGGNPEIGKHLEAVFKGALESTSSLVRQCAVCAGGLVAWQEISEGIYVKIMVPRAQ